MAKKNFGDLENGNKNMGGVSALFNPGQEKAKTVENEDLKKKHFSLTIPLDKYVYISSLINKKTSEGMYNYNLKDAFLEGLELLKKAFPNISSEKSLERRLYRGGEQKTKTESYNTSTVLLMADKNWIDSFIAEKRKKNQFFSKVDFIIELVEALENFYKKD